MSCLGQLSLFIILVYLLKYDCNICGNVHHILYRWRCFSFETSVWMQGEIGSVRTIFLHNSNARVDVSLEAISCNLMFSWLHFFGMNASESGYNGCRLWKSKQRYTIRLTQILLMTDIQAVLIPTVPSATCLRLYSSQMILYRRYVANPII